MNTGKKNMSLRTKILIAGVVTLCILIICACTIVGSKYIKLAYASMSKLHPSSFRL